ncbi:Wzz/FepE/Etk N-terminal domain-containing protein [Campylobacter sputorum]|uniref:Wzz/FepE/Etk N-terminal domain-containing protein n=1 Tax=Campylobacter sputorum TaxID=206 RepID=UPI00053C04D5|nr:Wzz/FepE/Etk N-terminal domain-containing protein [Campylobacter sputorum]
MQENIIEDEIDLIELFKTLLRYKFIIIGITSLFGILGFLYAFVLATPKYEVSAVFKSGYYKNIDKNIVNIFETITTLDIKYIKNLKKVPNLDFKFNAFKLLFYGFVA